VSAQPTGRVPNPVARLCAHKKSTAGKNLAVGGSRQFEIKLRAYLCISRPPTISVGEFNVFHRRISNGS